MSKIESGDTMLHEEPLYLSKTMKIVDGVCRQAAVDKHQIFDMDIEEIVTTIGINKQSIYNLLSSALKIMRKHKIEEAVSLFVLFIIDRL